MRLRLIQRCTVLCPTFFGAFCIALLLAAALSWCAVYAESFLSLTDRTPGEVLVVEGWIGRDGVRAAAAEFVRGGYRHVITSGGFTQSEGWEEGGWSYAEGAQHELIRLGIPTSKIIVARSRDTRNRRTFESAVAVWQVLRENGMHPKFINVLTAGPHARRSRLVFEKVAGPEVKVGVISWVASDQEKLKWWQSSERARELVAESAGYLYEVFFNSGRWSNAPWDKSSIHSLTLKCKAPQPGDFTRIFADLIRVQGGVHECSRTRQPGCESYFPEEIR